MEVLTALDRDRIAGLLQRDEFFWLDLTAPCRAGPGRSWRTCWASTRVAARDSGGVVLGCRDVDAFDGYLVLVYFGIGGASAATRSRRSRCAW